jgi:hypothetical protein
MINTTNHLYLNALFQFLIYMTWFLAREKDLEAQLAASMKAVSDAKARLVTLQAKCKKDIAVVEARATKAENNLAEMKQRQAAREKSLVEHVDAMSTMFGSMLFCPCSETFSIACFRLFIDKPLPWCCSRADWRDLQTSC